ncbi:LuxR C-terminal-related transcriptional regulator [Streptomyces sp. NPDC049602]|uniref:helix-turn-helix transcriptional regulator n=1 Tax=Streptomyces sp. NPDC049602 TaxID=3155504 RepID=UPI003448A10F
MKLVERAVEQEALESALAACGAGRGATVLVEAAVGCGKSELLARVAERAAFQGAVVLRATGSAAESGLPLGALSQVAAGAPPGALDPRHQGAGGRGESMELFSSAVRRLAGQGPVVICVDDWQHADHLSRHYLLHLAHAARTAGILLVLARSLDGREADPVLDTELIRLPRLVRLRLSPLSPVAVAELLRDEGIEDEEAHRGIHHASGGNPLLVRALLDDLRGAPEDTRPQQDGAFGRALLACLQRNGSGTVELANALAVLDDLATPGHAAALAGAPVSRTARMAEALGAAGLLDGVRFRHPAARAAVLDRMAPAHRTALHRTAAAVVHADGADAPAVAEHLVAARDVSRPWAVPVLRSAAAQLLCAGRPRRALACLELAGEGIDDASARHDNRLGLAEIASRIDPGDAELRLSAALEHARARRTGPAGTSALARLLIGQGRLDEAEEVLGLLDVDDRVIVDDRVTGGDAVTAGDRASVYRGPCAEGARTDPLDGLAAFPRRAATRRHQAPHERDGTSGVPGATREHPAGPGAAPWLLPDGSPAAAAAAAEAFLRGSSAGRATIEPTVQALRTLLYLGGAVRALPWCRDLVEETERRASPGWGVLLRTLHAEALLRQGDLDGAEREALAALESVPRSPGSATMCGVTGVLMRARLALGRTDSVAAELARPVPETLLGSVHGLAYLRARGQFHLATSRHHAALGDFLEIGRRMRRWGLDRPVVLPWRTDAAEALYRLGESAQAERFVTQQLATPDAVDPWVQGISLRLRATLQEPRKRQALLARATEALRRSGDRYELARALGDFGNALRDCGESARAAMVNRTAWHLADECGAHPLRNTVTLVGSPPAPAAPPVTASFAELAEQLSDSERRVAALAVRGDTNKEIAGKLFITVSTVEQHLTRAYRKLGITRRQDLPVELQLIAAEV